jgi:hypothetical protein
LERIFEATGRRKYPKGHLFKARAIKKAPKALKYTESDSKIGMWQRGALNLCQAQPVPKAKGVSKNASFLGRGRCS